MLQRDVALGVQVDRRRGTPRITFDPGGTPRKNIWEPFSFRVFGGLQELFAQA